MDEEVVIKPYNPTDWKDHIVDKSLKEDDPNYVVQEGTRFTAERFDNMEDGILGAYGTLNFMLEEIKRLHAEMEVLGRAPVNNGSFLDVLDGVNERNIEALSEESTSPTAIAAGATKITADSSPFRKGMVITVYDNLKSEDVLISAVAGKVLTVGALKNSYKAGASLGRSSVSIADEKMSHGAWGTFSITITEVVA